MGTNIDRQSDEAAFVHNVLHENSARSSGRPNLSVCAHNDLGRVQIKNTIISQSLSNRDILFGCSPTVSDCNDVTHIRRPSISWLGTSLAVSDRTSVPSNPWDPGTTMDFPGRLRCAQLNKL